ncbi:MAG TPA: DUF4178 domain-containing protein [Noviherbaspirillum sp.]
MQKVSCPSCGAEVVFRSAASVMAVCEYCRSTLLKDAGSVKDIGKVSEVLEDYSPIRINTSGSFQGRTFAVVGRIQLRYDAGFWNEWHILFDDGSSGWLSDASGQYVITLPQPPLEGGVPEFEEIKPGFRYMFDGTSFFASDIRTAHCIAWEGELPFQVGRGWVAKVADCSAAHRFLTLDYSDGGLPQLFAGQAVTLDALRCQLLRDNDAIASTAGRFRGQTTALDCPSCGSAVQYKAGMAFHVVCPSCHAEVDCSMDKVLVLQKAEELAAIVTTLGLGDIGIVNGVKYEVIGLLQCRTCEEDASSTWVEYFLFNAQQGFLWLVESVEGWDRVDVLNEWPAQQHGVVDLKGEKFGSPEEYESEVIYAAGAFNWRVSVGDKTRIRDFSKGNRKVSSETNDQEIVWTSSAKVSAAQIGRWFGKPIVTPVETEGKAGPVLSYTAPIIYSALLATLNVPISFLTGARGLKLMFWALVLLWTPVVITRLLGKDH